MKNMNDLRGDLVKTLEDLRNKTIDAATANARANLHGKIIGTIKLEMEYARMTNQKPKSDFIQIEEKVTIAPAEPAPTQ